LFGRLLIVFSLLLTSLLVTPGPVEALPPGQEIPGMAFCGK